MLFPLHFPFPSLPCPPSTSTAHNTAPTSSHAHQHRHILSSLPHHNLVHQVHNMRSPPSCAPSHGLSPPSPLRTPCAILTHIYTHTHTHARSRYHITPYQQSIRATAPPPAPGLYRAPGAASVGRLLRCGYVHTCMRQILPFTFASGAGKVALGRFC